MLSPSQRKEILEQQIEKHRGEGMEVVARTDTMAHLRRKPPPMNRWILLGGLLTLGVVTLLYIRWHAQRYREENVMLEITVDGEVLVDYR